MLTYVLRRLLMLLPVLLGVTFLTFAIARATPGDPARLMLGVHATPERIAELREHMGLSDPLLVQYVRYVWGAAHGDLGKSFRGQTPVMQEILDRFPSTLELTVAAMLTAIVGGILLGVIAATAKRKAVDGAAMATALLGISIPNFWLAIILIIIFGINLKWVSVTGGQGLRDLVLPSFCLALGPLATVARLTRSCILEVVREDYVRTAWAKGLRDWAVTTRHVLRNALIPVVTVIGLQFASLLGGTVFIESVFARPGIGRFAVNAILMRDYPQIQGTVLFVATIYVLVNLGVDLLYAFLDPRIRYG
ncbi:MAG TPA: ABC transporter permease [Anaerolineae bacterium]|nr:ABC transporter permease [Anaerolineae bacterium]